MSSQDRREKNLAQQLGAALTLVRKAGNTGILSRWVAYELRTGTTRTANLLRALEEDGHVKCVSGRWYGLASNGKPMSETARRILARYHQSVGA